MTTRRRLDHQLVEEARTLGGHKTKREAITSALTEYVVRLRQRQIISLFGQIPIDPHYNYKAARLRSRFNGSGSLRPTEGGRSGS